MDINEMTEEQLKAQIITNARTMVKMVEEIGHLNGEKIQLGVQLEMHTEHKTKLEKENERLLGVIAELKEGKKSKGAK